MLRIIFVQMRLDFVLTTSLFDDLVFRFGTSPSCASGHRVSVAQHSQTRGTHRHAYKSDIQRAK